MATDPAAYTRIKLDRDGEILFITLDRPDQLNAVDAVMHSELVRAFGELVEDSARVVVLTGAGRGFCSGGDVAHMDETGGRLLARHPDRVRSDGWYLVQAILEVEQPVIAMINGPAVGLGATLALLCDCSLIAESAVIGDTHVNIGLVAGDGAAAIISMLVGVNRSKELLMTGRLLRGREAVDAGLVNHVAADHELRIRTLELANEIARQPPFAVRATKLIINRMLRNAMEQTLDTGLAWEHLSMRRDDHLEAVAAWTTRRKDG